MKANQKRILSIAVSLLLTVCIMLQGNITLLAVESETDAALTDCGEWYYVLCDGGVELTGYTGTATDIYVPSSVEIDGAEYAVVRLGDSAFEDNDSLNSITLGAGIAEIGSRTFYDCDNMVCILLAEETTAIGEEAFYSCDSFNSVILYDAIVTIGTNAFAECPSLVIWCNKGSVDYNYAVENNIAYELLTTDAQPETVIQDGITYYIMNGEDIAIGFDGSATEVTVPNIVNGYPVTELRGTFKDCDSITKVVLSDGIKIIGENTFYNCTKLIDINISDSIITISTAAFSYCKSLVNIEIPDNVSEIGNKAFYSCSLLEKIVLPKKITKIAEETFNDCSALKDVIIPDNVNSIGSSAFSSCSSLSEIIIPDSVTTIGFSTFQGTALNQVVIPKSVTAIKDSSFSSITILMVYENSYAHTFAEKNDFLYFIYDGTNQPELYFLDGVKYYIFNGNAIAIDYNGTNTEVVIPETVNGYPVTELRATFSGCENIIKVSLPNGLKIIGKSAFNGCKNLTEVNIPESVTLIKEYAFYFCEKLSSITLSDNVSYIEHRAFAYCRNISVFKIPENVTVIENATFHACSNLKEVIIPYGVTNIDDGAFAYCYALEKVIIPNSVTSIGFDAFEYCYSLSSIVIPSSVKSIGSYAFRDCTALETVILSEGIKIINNYVFTNCTSIRKVIIPESVSTIYTTSFPANTILMVYENSYAHSFAVKNELLYFTYDGTNEPEIVVLDNVTYCISNGEATALDYDDSNNIGVFDIILPSSVNGFPLIEIRGTFSDCELLRNVILPDGLKVIGKNAFKNTGVSSIYIPDTVTVIDDYAFYNCRYGLKSIVLPESITTIGTSAFYMCLNLESINLPDSITYIGSSAFFGCDSLKTIILPSEISTINDSVFHGCENLSSIIIPENVTVIGNGAFRYCTNLKEIFIPDSVVTIEPWAFSDCDSLVSMDLPDSLTQIENYMFSGCDELLYINIPEKVVSIGSHAFFNCKKLQNITISSNMTSIGYYSFVGCDNLLFVFIPESLTKINSDSFLTHTILMVYENSYAHTFAVDNGLLYFIMRKTENPEIHYGAGIAGTVTYTDGTAASGAEVEIIYDDGVLKESVVTDENGAYEFTYAEVGRYTLKVTDSNGNTANTAASVKRMNVFDVFVAGDTALTLKKAYSVSGTVNEAGANIILTDINGNVLAEAIADENGVFTIPDVPNGTYIIKAEASSGSAVQEITVFDGEISDITLTIEAETAGIWGYVEVEDREKEHHRRNWVNVTVYNDEGLTVAQCKSDKDGRYEFNNLPVGEYTVVAEAAEMRPDKKHGYDRSYTLTGYAYINITEAAEYQVDTIVLYEENDFLAEISGKVTAKGSSQVCEVMLTNVFRYEIDSTSTTENGKYIFKNVRDGLYIITAKTENYGVGFAVVAVRNGKIYGDTDIKVEKKQEIKDREDRFKDDLKDCNDRETAKKHKDRIAEEKRYYDSLSEKEKKQISKEYVDRLNELSEWAADCEYQTDEGITVEGGGSVISGKELENEESISFTLRVEKKEAHKLSGDGVKTGDDFIQHYMEDAAGKREIKEYYEISMFKTTGDTEKEITSVYKDTDANGKFRITMTIPEEYRGYKHYSFVHVHHGEVVTLTDLDNDPNTVTFEVDRFSTFALTATNEDLGSEIKSGDVNTDGTVLSDDMVDMKKILLGIDNQYNTYAADVNNDDETNILDFINLKKRLAN